MKRNSNPYVLVTGASNGIGKGIVEECAAKGLNVLLVALEDESLHQYLAELKQRYPSQSFDAFGVNLCLPESPYQVKEWCEKNSYHVEILVNNVGMGNAGAFQKLPTDFYQCQLQLNISTLVVLTHLFLPDLESAPKGYILNVSSLAAFFDIPYKSTYAASKKFVLGFSRSLRKELEATNVTVTVLCPAAVLTSAEVIQRDKEMGKAAKWTQQSIEEVAKYGLNHMFKGHPIAIPGFLPKAYRVVSWFIPHPILMRMLARAFERAYVKGRDEK
ncbi:MAG: SDR family NAD(P)-dependent oxidoreductase [Saprospiraceae bacterium]